RLANLDDGSWTIDVAMVGFSPIRRDIVVSPDTPPADFPLTVLPFDQIAAGRTVRNEPAPVAPSTGGSKPSPRPPSGGGFEPAAGGGRLGARRRDAESCRLCAGSHARGGGARWRRGGRRRRCRRRSIGRRRRWIPDQREREQQRRLAVRAAAGVRQQPPRTAF